METRRSISVERFVRALSDIYTDKHGVKVRVTARRKGDDL